MLNRYYNIKEANAVYTGGGIWLFYGSLMDGNYFLTDDNGWTQILNTDPSNLDESTFEDWQIQHLVCDLNSKDKMVAMLFCENLISYLKENKDHRGGMEDSEIEIYRNWFRDFNY